MEINFTPAEQEAIEALAKMKEMSEANVIRQALRLYQFYDAKLLQGKTVQWLNQDGTIEQPLCGGCAAKD